ncbi:hypothetical protein BT69DRAFT_1279323 [Atractiella rhizophila]|nr:hypothetical protein BT69DRAFT_1282911 [Atractiella rhizophila]KAH8925940.1 hypothetical protein BT69DRAFT_1279323 [Atractiella rhizophila]
MNLRRTINNIGTRFFSVFALATCLGWEGVSAQSINGQFFTPGLVIVDAPAAGNPTTVGSTMPIAIDISGDGLLPFPPPSPIASNDLPTAILSLDLYLVSSKNNVNVTVSEGTGLLEQESGSTVKHLNYRVPDCLPAGDYNLTFYEVDRINQETFFAIYAIPVSINRPSQANGTNCTGTVEVRPAEKQPQDDNRSPQQPFSGPGQTNFPISTSGATTQGYTTLTTEVQYMTTIFIPTTTQSSGIEIVVNVPQPTVIISEVTVAVPTNSMGQMTSDPEDMVNQGDFGVPIIDSAAPSRTMVSLLPPSFSLAVGFCMWFLL